MKKERKIDIPMTNEVYQQVLKFAAQWQLSMTAAARALMMRGLMMENQPKDAKGYKHDDRNV